MYVKCTCSGVTYKLSVPVLESDVYVKCTCSGELNLYRSIERTKI